MKSKPLPEKQSHIPVDHVALQVFIVGDQNTQRFYLYQHL